MDEPTLGGQEVQTGSATPFRAVAGFDGQFAGAVTGSLIRATPATALS
jgi:hypothetical protein